MRLRHRIGVGVLRILASASWLPGNAQFWLLWQVNRMMARPCTDCDDCEEAPR